MLTSLGYECTQSAYATYYKNIFGNVGPNFLYSIHNKIKIVKIISAKRKRDLISVSIYMDHLDVSIFTFIRNQLIKRCGHLYHFTFACILVLHLQWNITFSRNKIPEYWTQYGCNLSMQPEDNKMFTVIHTSQTFTSSESQTVNRLSGVSYHYKTTAYCHFRFINGVSCLKNHHVTRTPVSIFTIVL